MSWALWLVVAVVFAVVAMATTTLFVGPFAVGALADAPAALQFVIFIAVSALSFMVVRPIARRHRNMPPQIRTGTAALIGQTAVVLDDVSRDGGTVKLGGEVWSARAYE